MANSCIPGMKRKHGPGAGVDIAGGDREAEWPYTGTMVLGR